MLQYNSWHHPVYSKLPIRCKLRYHSEDHEEIEDLLYQITILFILISLAITLDKLMSLYHLMKLYQPKKVINDHCNGRGIKMNATQ